MPDGDLDEGDAAIAQAVAFMDGLSGWLYNLYAHNLRVATGHDGMTVQAAVQALNFATFRLGMACVMLAPEWAKAVYDYLATDDLPEELIGEEVEGYTPQIDAEVVRQITTQFPITLEEEFDDEH